ncbi:DUF2145 domain-containing protein [Mariprofundus sp. KV]|nr:DUF2145 domain-containing protein [Mariprofundus sp. KV]
MAATAEAGSGANAEPQFAAEEIIEFSKKVEKTVASKGARVFILARVGRPASELPEGIHFTHTAIGVYSRIKTADGREVPGYAIYNLYQRDKEPDVSDLVVDYPIDFFSGVYELKAGIVIPTPELQQRILQVIASNRHRSLHNSNYSVIANPYNSKYQNCTEHTLDVINAAIYQTDDMQVIKGNTKAYFDAQKVHISPFKLLAGSLFMPDVKTSDQKGGIKTSTYTTIASYLDKYDLVQEKLVITQ